MGNRGRPGDEREMSADNPVYCEIALDVGFRALQDAAIHHDSTELTAGTEKFASKFQSEETGSLGERQVADGESDVG